MGTFYFIQFLFSHFWETQTENLAVVLQAWSQQHHLNHDGQQNGKEFDHHVQTVNFFVKDMAKRISNVSKFHKL